MRPKTEVPMHPMLNHMAVNMAVKRVQRSDACWIMGNQIEPLHPRLSSI